MAMAKGGERPLLALTRMTSSAPRNSAYKVGRTSSLHRAQEATCPRSHKARGPSLNGYTPGPALRSRPLSLQMY